MLSVFSLNFNQHIQPAETAASPSANQCMIDLTNHLQLAHETILCTVKFFLYNTFDLFFFFFEGELTFLACGLGITLTFICKSLEE